MPEVKSVTYVEIDIPVCSLQWSKLPCRAVPYTGVTPCFNTVKTCQSRSTFSTKTVTLRFTLDTAFTEEDGIDAIPSLLGVSFSPGTVSLGEDLGIRSTLSLKFKDHPHSDAGDGFDPYYKQRSYNPYTQGTFWGKFRARQPYVYGMPVRLITGQLGQTLDQMETRHYIGDSFDGPNSDGTYTLKAKDVLRFASGDVAQAPVASLGYCSADVAIPDVTVTLLPTGIGDVDYGTSGWVCIGGNEICAFTRTSGSDVLNLTRGQLGTTAQTHKAQDTIQTVLYYNGVDPALIIQDLLQTYAFIPSTYITINDWKTETSTYLNQVYTAVIATPTNVDVLVSELIKQATLALWWEDQQQQIRLQVLRPISSSATVLDESKILAGSFKVTEQPSLRLTQCWVNFGMRDPTLPLTQLNNFTSVGVVDDAQAEFDYGSASAAISQNEQNNAVAVIDTINSRWIAEGGRTIAQALGTGRLNRYVNPPRKFNFDLLRYTDIVILGGGYNLSWWNLQNADGSPEIIPIQVTRLNPMADRLQVEAQEANFSAGGSSLNPNIHTITIDVSQDNLNLKSLHDANYVQATSGVTVICVINSGVTVGSRSTGTPALDIGTGWAAGVTIQLVNNGRIEGAGGNGGKGAAQNPPPGPVDGLPGGTALYTRQAITLNNAGLIYGGGGGGGGGTGNSSGAGGGGGGGAGASQNGIGANGGGGTGGSSGHAGTPDAGGSGGSSTNAGKGGNGGNPGFNGNSGAGGSPGSGGHAGNAIDGVSFITGASGTILGPQVN